MAQPITKWQAFRSYYARENPGVSVQQAAEAWETYKQRHGVVTKTSTKRSPKKSPKKSLKKSPIKGKQHAKSPPKSSPKSVMHKLTQPTLLGIPRELSGMIFNKLPDKELARMQSVSGRTKALTNKNIQEICNELPTQKEVLAFVKDMLVLRNFATCFFVHADQFHEPQVNSLYIEDGSFGYKNFLIMPGFGTYGILTASTGWLERNEGLGNVTTLANPETIRNILARRGSCSAQKGQYYADLMQRYIRSIIDPFLEPFISAENIKKMYAGQDIPDGEFIRPPQPNQIDGNDNPFKAYNLQVLRLILALGWLRNGRNIEDTIHEDDQENAARLFETLTRTIREIRQEYQYYKAPEVYTRTDIVYTTSDVVKYIQRHIRDKTSTRVAFYTISYEVTVRMLGRIEYGRVRSVSEYVVEDGVPQNVVTHSTDQTRDALKKITVKETPAQEAFDELLNQKIAPGMVDPITLSIMLQDQDDDSRIVNDSVELNVVMAAYHAGLLRHPMRSGYNMLLAGRFKDDLMILSTLFAHLLIIARWLGVPMPKEEAQTPASLSQAKQGIPKIMRKIDKIANY